jgi:hypothetical protein
METNLSLRQTRRLGFCKQTAPWPEADLGPSDLAQIYSSHRVAGRNSQAIRMAYISTHELHSTAKCRHRVQSDAGVAAAFLVMVHAGCLHAGNHARQTCSSGGMNGGDDETRTRDLCRDRAVPSVWLTRNQSVRACGSRQPLASLGMVGHTLCNDLCNTGPPTFRCRDP